VCDVFLASFNRLILKASTKKHNKINGLDLFRGLSSPRQKSRLRMQKIAFYVLLMEHAHINEIFGRMFLLGLTEFLKSATAKANKDAKNVVLHVLFERRYVTSIFCRPYHLGKTEFFNFEATNASRSKT
jgi:hypothetical protein